MSKFTAGLLTAAIVLAAGAAPSFADTAADDPAISIWSTAMSFTPGLRGDLTVAKAGDNWRATVGGVEVLAPATADHVKFTFPNNGGEFRGALQSDSIRGFWITPVTARTDPRDPGSSGQPYASPLTLKAAGEGTWRGTVVPLDNRFTLYLKIYRSPEGRLVAAFRNPEYNANGGFPLFNVARDGDKLQITASKEDAGRDIVFGAKLLRRPDRIEVVWPILNRSLQLIRRTPAEVKDFFPRPPGSPAYAYRAPPATADGWQVASAGSVGFDETALAGVVQKIIDIDPASRKAWLIHSIAVARHGKLVLDEYFYGFDRDRPHDLRSAGKTFSSVMLGALMMQGVKISPQTKAYELLAPLGPFANPDPRKAKITLAHLMTHNAGFACDDNDENSPGSEDKMQSQSEQPNWWKFTLDLPMAFEPGTHYAYCSANINLVGAALTTASRTWLPELFDRTIAQPLQFGAYSWNLMPTNEGYLGGGAYVRTRDFLKLGQAFLDGGIWNGRRIVDESWAKESLAPHARISPATTGLQGEAFQNVYWETDDGYAWHMLDVKSGDQRYHAYFANGNGGQLLLIVPQFDLVVAFTAGNYGQGVWNRERDDIVGGLVIPAIKAQ